ncbi:DUF2804 domain-containing protein [Alcanivorax sp. JB21]|uniref:DUF2804 domain-containing protein n=1 Tax=Alcanivorax limicola TaxID=2874102 RepID=UPI001CBD3255|nr:DUF2804 domain-containing protein [Alcanivorax limicola]MBZ2188209.1 DUF2804 domain-containing protein [Alcanivorax limicola]
MSNHNPPPAQLVADNGQVPFGFFSHSVADINGRDYDYRTPMGRPASRLAKHFHYKQFQYFGVISDTLLAGCALAHTGWIGIAFFYVFEPATGKLREHTWRSPLGQALTMSSSPVGGQSVFQQGKNRLQMGYAVEDETRVKTLSVTLPDLQLDVRMAETPAYQPMSLCTRTGINGWVYANKVAGVPVTGTLRQGAGSDAVDLAAIGACGHHDFSAGYMRRQTFWNWACLSGQSDGQHIGLNLSCGVNETSFTENCLWLDGQLIKVDTTAFEYDRDNLLTPWRIRTGDGQVDLQFEPLGNHRERMNLGVFASNFNQLFGRFQGTVTLQDGRTIAIRNLYGFVEEQYAKW